MSRSCRAHFFFGARLIQKNSSYYFFLFIFFPKYTLKDTKDTMKHIGEQISWLCALISFSLVSSSTKKSSSICHTVQKLWPTQIWHFCWRLKKKETWKQTTCCMGFMICHKLWDIYIFSLTIKWNRKALHSKTPHVVTVLWLDSDGVVTLHWSTSGTSGRLKTVYLCHLDSYTVTVSTRYLDDDHAVTDGYLLGA